MDQRPEQTYRSLDHTSTHTHTQFNSGSMSESGTSIFISKTVILELFLGRMKYLLHTSVKMSQCYSNDLGKKQ